MLRKSLAHYLDSEGMTLRQLARLVRKDERELKEDLAHLQKSLRHQQQELLITPAECRQCHFTFRSKVYHKPSRCPTCKSTWIQEPVLRITSNH